MELVERGEVRVVFSYPFELLLAELFSIGISGVHHLPPLGSLHLALFSRVLPPR